MNTQHLQTDLLQSGLLIASLWGTLALAITFLLWALSAKRPFGGEDDLWSAQRLCELLAPRLSVSAEEIGEMWSNPQKHPDLARRANALLAELDREWRQDTPGGPVKGTLRVRWTSGAQSETSGEIPWDDLPSATRAHLIKGGPQPLRLPFKPSFLAIG